MSIPQNVLDALNAVQADADNLVAAQAQATTATTTLAGAQNANVIALAAVSSAQAHVTTDLAALQTLLNQTYGPGVVPPPAPVPAPPSAS